MGSFQLRPPSPRKSGEGGGTPLYPPPFPLPSQPPPLPPLGLHWHRFGVGWGAMTPPIPVLAGIPWKLLACDKQPSQPSPAREGRRSPSPAGRLLSHSLPSPACPFAAPGIARRTPPSSPMDALPEPLLVRILAGLPALDLVLVCRLVCSQWKALVDGGALWLLKCQEEGFAGKDADEEGAESWQTLYFLHKKKRNLVKNPNGEEDLQHWEDVQNGGDGWKVEELPGDFGKDFPKEEVHTYFVSSFDWCSKSQIIDLQAEGYWEELMDTTQPKIVVKDWYAARCDAGCLYHLKVKLLSANEDTVAEFESETIAVPQDNEGEWAEITHTFADYGPGVRFVRFEHGGQDTVFWKGWYGARVTSSTVTVEP
ncbi:LOW QUALITY PROTEIN: F-box only protein 2 [Pituophis catenifer annectens]|uniref:LOW QUALITY PROTEIN: F-box only protein 2 n=1 Tax=Pituophis catenifer annectens TaxID=94852 RepID=UPI00399216A0